MKKIACIVVAIIFCAMFTFQHQIHNAAAAEWYEGGTLHGEPVQVWLSSTAENIVATTADIVAATTDSAELRKQGSSTLKNASIDAAKCMVQATDGVQAVQHQKGSQFIVLCLAQLKPQYPWLLTKAK